MKIPRDGRIALTALGFNLSLALFKYWLSVLSGSVALKADAVHSFSDVVSSASLFAGIMLSRRHSKTFPYGLYKLENLISLGVSFLILLAGYEIAREAFLSRKGLMVEEIPFAMAGVGITVLATYLFSRWIGGKAREFNSPSLSAEAYHVRSDMLSSTMILGGLLGGLLRFSYLDKAAALVMVALIARMGLGIALQAIRVLLDASLDFQTLDKIKAIILSDPRVAEIKGLWGRNSGKYRFIEAELILKVRDFERAHRAVMALEDKIRQEVPFVDHILIHYEPEHKDSLTYAVPLEVDKERLSEHFGEAPYFYFVKFRLSDGKVLDEKVLRNPYAEEGKGRGMKVSHWLLKEGVDKLVSRADLEGKGPFYVLSNAGVEVLKASDERLKDLEFDLGGTAQGLHRA